MKKTNNIFKAALILAFALLISPGCGKKKDPTNIKAAGSYEVADHYYMYIGQDIVDGDLAYSMVITPVGEEDTVMLSNVNKTFDNVMGRFKNDSLVIFKQTTKSQSGGKYDIDETKGILKENKLTIDFQYDDRPYENLTGIVLCGLTATRTSQPSSK